MEVKPRPWTALKVIFVSQMLISFVPAIGPVLAADMAPRLGVNADRIGVFSALTYLWAIVGGVLVGPWIGWIGPVRAVQIMLLAAALGAWLAALGNLTGVLLAAVALGASLSFPHPAFTAILGRHAPRQSIGLFISLRFSAAPIGIALAGVLVPAAVNTLGERWTIAAAGMACALAAFSVGRTVKALDWRDALRPTRIDLTSAVRHVWAHPGLVRLALVCMVFAMVQQAFLAYAVLLLVSLGLPLPTSAGLLAISQIVAVIGRIVMGHASDRWVTPRAMLCVYGLGMGVACIALARLPASPGMPLVATVMALIAVTAMGWPGMMAAQLLRLSLASQVATNSSGSQVFIFSGAVVGPYLIAIALGWGAGYEWAFMGLGVLAILAGLSMLTPGARLTDKPHCADQTDRP
ncbi:MAG: MFS transporter [Hydrogenophaga sp.]|nr:MFS transporter [Hydrogenophaga sp.]